MRAVKYLLFILISLIVGCSLFKTSYNSAPKLVIWWLDDYFDLNQSQQLVLEPALQGLHNWHRQHQLPQHIEQLKSFQISLDANNLTAQTVCNQIQSAKITVYALQTQSIPAILKLALLLDDKQLSRFEQKLDKRTQKWKKEWWQNSKEDQLSVRLDKAEDFAEKVYGDINAEQLTLIKQRLILANSNPEKSYNEILRRNIDAFNILKALKTPKPANINGKEFDDSAIDLVQAGFDRMQKSPNADYQQYVNTLNSHSCETVAALHATTNEKQRLHAKNWINEYIVQLTALQAK